MNEERVADCLHHMVVCANRIATLMPQTSRAEFVENYMHHNVAIREFEILGEAATRNRREYPGFAETHHLTNFDTAIGMRNRLAHQYEGVDLELVWEVITIDIPALRAAVLPILWSLDPHAGVDSLHF